MTGNSWWVTQQGVLWVLELATGDANTLPAAVKPGIAAVFEELHVDDAGSLATVLGHADNGQIVRRMAYGRRCFMARVAGEIAAYGWVSSGRECVGEMGREIRLSPGEAYVWDCVTLPDYRKQGLYTALLGYINGLLFGEGYSRIWIGSNLENQPSIRGFKGAGYRPAVKISRLGLGSLNFLWVSPLEKAGKKLVMAARDVFSLETDRRAGPLVFGRVNEARLLACLELQD